MPSTSIDPMAGRPPELRPARPKGPAAPLQLLQAPLLPSQTGSMTRAGLSCMRLAATFMSRRASSLVNTLLRLHL